MIKPKEKNYGERGRRWRKSTETSWFKRNKNDLLIVLCLCIAIAFAYFMYPILFSD